MTSPVKTTTKKRVHNPYAFSYECIKARKEKEQLALLPDAQHHNQGSYCGDAHVVFDECFDGSSSHYTTTTPDHERHDEEHYDGSDARDDDEGFYHQFAYDEFHDGSNFVPSPMHSMNLATMMPPPPLPTHPSVSSLHRGAPPCFSYPGPPPPPPMGMPAGLAVPPPPFVFTPAPIFQNLPQRNKAIVCKRFVEGGDCSEHSGNNSNSNNKSKCGSRTGCMLGGVCPYRHVSATFEEPVPRSICKFFLNGACLRDNCTFFHGTSEQLAKLTHSGCAMYRPAEVCPVLDAEENKTK